MLKDWIILICGVLFYSFCMIYSGMLMEKRYVESILPRIQSKAYIQGIKDCRQFEENQKHRDLIQDSATERFIQIYNKVKK